MDATHCPPRFVLLINRLGSVSPTRRGKSTAQSPKKRLRRLEIIREWVQELRTAHPQLTPTITAMFFRFLFPNEDTRRRYNMKEAALAKTMCQVFGLHGHRNQRAKFLMHWDSSFETKSSSGTGCLGDEIRNVFVETFQVLFSTSDKKNELTPG
jgi:DNA ligase-4